MEVGNFFTTKELASPSKLKPDVLPTKHESLLYVYSRTVHKLRHDNVVLDFARKVVKIWEKADCCPVTITNAVEKFEKDIWQIYRYLMRERSLPGVSTAAAAEKRSHKAKKPKMSSPPTRRSSRLGDGGQIEELSEDQDETDEPETQQDRAQRKLPRDQH